MAGFKITATSELTQASSYLSENTATAEAKITDTVATIESLKSNMSGEGVDTALEKLSEQVQSLGSTLTTLMTDIYMFIDTQVSSYTMSTEDANASLETILNNMQNVNTADGGITQ